MDLGCQSVLHDDGHQAMVLLIAAVGRVVSVMTDTGRRVLGAQHVLTGWQSPALHVCLTLNHDRQEGTEEGEDIHWNKPHGQALNAGKRGKSQKQKTDQQFPY